MTTPKEQDKILCAYCGREANPPYWRRTFSYSVLCKDCYLLPYEDISTAVCRREFALLLRDARKVSHAAARHLYNDFRGCGIPINPNRRKKP